MTTTTPVGIDPRIRERRKDKTLGGISIKELSEKLEARARDVIKKLLDKGIFATINQTLDSQTATEMARAFGAQTSVISYEEEVIHEVERGGHR